MNTGKRDQLLDALIEGDLSEADFIRIEAELVVNTEARQAYYRRLGLTVLLEQTASSRSVSGSGGRESGSLAGLAGRRGFWVGLCAAAIFMVIGILGIFVVSDLATEHRATGDAAASGPGDSEHAVVKVSVHEEQAAGFAVIAGQADAEWSSHGLLLNGDLIPQGELHLVSGLVQIELFSGVTVVIEGAARFAVLSPMEIAVTRGKARVHVPEPAQGFRVRLRDGEVVDLGTDFAVSVMDEHSEVHVLDGAVEWRPHEQDMRLLKDGEAFRWSADGVGRSMPSAIDGFVDSVRLQDHLASARKLQEANWHRYAESLRRDPRLTVHYQMGVVEDSGRQLPNRALMGGERLASEGAVVAAGRSTDRWGRPNGALDFSPTGSRVRLFVPGEYQSLTLLCWVKINSLDRWYNSLFLTDGHEINEPHWQLMDDGRLFFSVKKRDVFDKQKGEADKHVYYSPAFWDSTLSGKWVMLATVYDTQARTVTHFLNGEVLSEEAIPEEYLVDQIHIGHASLCNWGLPTWDNPRFAVRNLNGSMDEFAMFSAPLAPDEIKEIYQHGKP